MFPLNCSLSVFQFKRICTTAESRLHIAMDCGRWSLVRLCGLTDWGGLNFTIHTPLLTSDDAGVSLRPVWLATHVIVSCGHSTNQTTCGLLSPTSCGWLTGGRHPAVCLWPFRWHQMTVFNIIIAVLHRFKRKACWPMCVRDFVQLLLWIRSVPVSNAHVRRAFIHHIVRPHVVAWLTASLALAYEVHY